LANLINLIASSPELQPYAVGKLYLALQADIKPVSFRKQRYMCLKCPLPFLSASNLWYK